MDPSISGIQLRPSFSETHPQPVNLGANMLLRCPNCCNYCTKQLINPAEIDHFRFACYYCNYTSEENIDKFKLHNLLKIHEQQQHQYNQYLQHHVQHEQRERAQPQQQDYGNNGGPVSPSSHPFSIRRLLEFQDSPSENHTSSSNIIGPSNYYSDSTGRSNEETVGPLLEKHSDFNGLRINKMVTTTADKTLKCKTSTLKDLNPINLPCCRDLSSPVNLPNSVNVSSPIHLSSFQNSSSSLVSSSPLDLSKSNLLNASHSTAMKSTVSRKKSTVIEPCKVMQSDLKQQYICYHCELIFLDSEMYTMHAGFHNIKNHLMCNLCGIITSNKKDFFAHIATAKH